MENSAPPNSLHFSKSQTSEVTQVVQQVEETNSMPLTEPKKKTIPLIFKLGFYIKN
ncbi:hypothetical protein BpHYR1_019987 [Brachionus plicatilis]|uniref:Uncharacterized protein n=1 Tax=Brachionus plicatilis TaxID=10195 RepID=A0A3M7PCZ2_BRAPC|nr:hypothetical protein BpHYR1_019987 [Brachionus plicatilis]